MVFSSVNTNTLSDRRITNLHLAGPEFEYFIALHKLIFPPLLLFSGLAYCRNCQNDERINYFVEPGIKIYLNVSLFMRVSVNANYRMLQQKAGFNAHILNGSNFAFSVAYGKF